MAYMSQERKAKIAAVLKGVVPAGWKYSLAVRHHSTIVMTITAAPVDLMAEAIRTTLVRVENGPYHTGQYVAQIRAYTHVDVNPYYPQNTFDESLPTIKAILAALNDGNHDRSDVMTDYFDVGWYVDLNIGRSERPFVCTATAKAA